MPLLGAPLPVHPSRLSPRTAEKRARALSGRRVVPGIREEEEDVHGDDQDADGKRNRRGLLVDSRPMLLRLARDARARRRSRPASTVPVASSTRSSSSSTGRALGSALLSSAGEIPLAVSLPQLGSLLTQTHPPNHARDTADVFDGTLGLAGRRVVDPSRKLSPVLSRRSQHDPEQHNRPQKPEKEPLIARQAKANRRPTSRLTTASTNNPASSRAAPPARNVSTSGIDTFELDASESTCGIANTTKEAGKFSRSKSQQRSLTAAIFPDLALTGRSNPSQDRPAPQLGPLQGPTTLADAILSLTDFGQDESKPYLTGGSGPLRRKRPHERKPSDGDLPLKRPRQEE